MGKPTQITCISCFRQQQRPRHPTRPFTSSIPYSSFSQQGFLPAAFVFCAYGCFTIHFPPFTSWHLPFVMKRSDCSPSVMQFMKLSVLLFSIPDAAFPSRSLAAKVFRFPKVIGFQSYGLPKAALVFQRGFGSAPKGFFRYVFLYNIFAFPAEIVRSCSLEESRHRSAKHWYGITLFRIFLWLLQHFSGIKPSGPTCSGKDFGGALFAPERNLQK